MQNKSKKLLLTGCLAASMATLGLTGCHTEDRTAGRYMDDRRIANRVEGNLDNDPVYKYRDVKVNVFDGVAQLSGFVDTQHQITTAANIAARTEGVREVINDIAIKPQFKLVPTGSQAGRRYESNTGNPGQNTGSNTGSGTSNGTVYENQNWNANKPTAPIVTPNQASPATPPTGNNNNNTDSNQK